MRAVLILKVIRSCAGNIHARLEKTLIFCFLSFPNFLCQWYRWVYRQLAIVTDQSIYAAFPIPGACGVYIATIYDRNSLSLSKIT